MNIKRLEHIQFGDTPVLIDQLAELIARGVKTATSSAYSGSDQNVKAGRKVVVLDSLKKPVCVIQVEKVETVPFNEVTQEFAYLEGEGDRTLAYWQKEHKRFFESQDVFAHDMLLRCEYFTVVHIFK